MARDRRRASIHEEFLLLAAAAVDGRIDADSAAALEAHLATCEQCRAAQAAMLADHAWLAEPAAPVMPRPEVRAFVMDAARAPRVPLTSDRRPSLSPLLVAGVIVALVGTVAIGMANREPGIGAGVASQSLAVPTPTKVVAPEGCVTIPDGASARWPFDGFINDQINDLEFTVGGGADLAEGITGGGLHMTGSTSTATVNDLRFTAFGTGDLTISLWIRFQESVRNQVLVERWSQSTIEGWTLTTTDRGEVRLAVATDRAGLDRELDVDTTGANLVAGRWHHVVARRESKRFAIFVDGFRRAVAELPPGVEANLFLPVPMLIGHREPGDGRDFSLKGDLDELMIWTGRALGDFEVAELYRAGGDKFCEAAAAAAADAEISGTWRSVDCASIGSTRRCDVWGDESELKLAIGAGERPDARYEDASQAGCGPGGGAGPGVATGVGSYIGTTLEIRFVGSTCLASSGSWSNPMYLLRAPGARELWNDSDGDDLGLTWRPD